MKIELIISDVKCPYCGHVNSIAYPVDNYRTADVLWCDSEDGGCDKKFVILNPHEITFKSKVFKMSDKAES
ncbi:hypothetical protein ES705_36157 [subsurface metagenome]